MALADATRNRLVGLLVVALAALVARVVAGVLSAPVVVERGFYLLALACLAASLLVVVRERL